MKKFLKPAREGLIVRDPVSFQPLKENGEEKEIGSYWDRRIVQGDVVEVEKSEPEKTPAPKTSQKIKET